MRCIECEEIELARVRDERPAQTLPIPYAALDGFPAGRTAADLTRRRLLQWGVAGFASVYGAKELGFEQVWESVARRARRAEQKALVVLYLAGGNDGLNVLVPERGRPTTRPTSAARPYDPPRGRAPSTSRRASARRRCPGPGGAALAFANVTVSKNGGGDNSATRFNFTGTAATGSASTRCSATARGGAGSDLAVMPAVDAKQYNLSHFDNSDIWFRASQRRQHQDGLARPLARALRLGHQPAAGDLDRHGAVEGDPHGGEAGVRDPVAADGRLHDELEQYGGVNE